MQQRFFEIKNVHFAYRKNYYNNKQSKQANVNKCLI